MGNTASLCDSTPAPGGVVSETESPVEPRAYRLMRRDGNVPALGKSASTLGIRVPKDIEADSAGNVTPTGTHGMSVRPTLDAYPGTWLPQRLQNLDPVRFRNAAGSNNVWGFRLGNGAFVAAPIGELLRLAPDTNDHGVIEPAKKMQLTDFERAVDNTQNDWVIDES